MVWMKRINAPKWWPIERKKSRYIAVPRGSQKMKIPLIIVLRDVLKLVDTTKEGKSVINTGKVLIDGKKRKDVKYGVGPMDVITIPDMEKSWRAVPRDGITFVEVNDSDVKVCKILDKTILKKGKTQLNLSDGRNLLTDGKYSTNDSVLIEVPSQKIKDTYEMKNGNTIIVTGGKYEGLISTIGEIDKKNRRMWIEHNERKIEIPLRLTTVVGKEKTAVMLE